MNGQLKPCPVCGGKAHLRKVSDTTGWDDDYAFVFCNGDCGSKVSTFAYWGKGCEGEAMAAWNFGEIRRKTNV